MSFDLQQGDQPKAVPMPASITMTPVQEAAVDKYVDQGLSYNEAMIRANVIPASTSIPLFEQATSSDTKEPSSFGYRQHPLRRGYEASGHRKFATMSRRQQMQADVDEARARHSPYPPSWM